MPQVPQVSLAFSRRSIFCMSSALAVSLLAPAALHAPLYAQTVTATIQGTVMDTGGAAVPAAKVTVRNTATGSTRVLTADAGGRYTAPNLQPGPYTLLVEAPGFASKTFSNITLSVGDDQRLDPHIDVGAVSETVNVSGTEDLIQTNTSSNATLVDNKQVVELPLANRQFYSLALLSPAAYQPAQNSTLGFRGGINIAGASEISNQFTYNGIFDNDLGVGQPSYRPSVETIQEFRLLTGVYPAEYGRLSGGQVVIISKSGTNQFHGSAYEFFRNEYTDAKPYFTLPGAKKPSFKQNTFGGTIGGPIFRDKTFFFFGYEGQRIRQAVTAQATVPTADMLKGIFNTGEVLYNPNNGQPLMPVAGTTTTYNLAAITGAVNTTTPGALAGQSIAKLGFPTPTAPTAAGKLPSNNYTFQETRSENLNEFTIRGDHHFNDKNLLSASYNIFRDPAFEPSNSLCSSYVLPNFGCFTNQISTLIGVNYDRTVSANIVNSLRVGYQRLNQPRVQQDNTSIGTAFAGLPGGPYFNQPGYANNLGLPNTSFGQGFSTVGGATNLPQVRYDNHYQIADTLTYAHGNHTFKGGVDLLLAKSVNVITSSGRGAFSVNDSNIITANGGPTIKNAAGVTVTNPNAHLGSTGDSIADLLTGLAYTSTIGTTAGTVYLNFQGYDAFFQDDWKIAPNLTLNLGVRYELDVPVYSPNNTISNFDLPTQQFIQAGINGNFNHLYNYDYNNVAPRIGFSWQPYHDERTVIKGGTGIFYNQPLLYNQFLSNGTQSPFRNVSTFTSIASTLAQVRSINLNTPFTIPGANALPACSTGTQSACNAALTPLNIQARYATPELMEWSLGVQQSFGRSVVFESTYFGSKGTKLPQSISVNVINPNNPAILAGTAGSQSMRPYPNFSTISSQDTRSNSEFHSWQNSLKQTNHNGVSFILAYTFAKSIDGSGGIGSGSNSSGTPQNPYNLRAERGLSDFDVRHRVVFSPVALLPFGKGRAYLNNGIASHVLGGFQVSGIFTFQTGRPFTIFDSATNQSGLFGNNDRPNFNPAVTNPNPNARINPVNGTPTHTVAQWFNTGAYILNPKGTFGNAGRNQVIGPQFTELDLTLARYFPIYERVSGEFRAEAFNLLNHGNFFNPLSSGAQFGATGFGSITQANTSRDLQFSLRFIF